MGRAPHRARPIWIIGNCHQNVETLCFQHFLQRLTEPWQQNCHCLHVRLTREQLSIGCGQPLIPTWDDALLVSSIYS